jgi:signal transduction histidine kinase
MIDYTSHTILLWITGILIFSFDVVVYFGSKNISSRLFAVFSSFVGIWSISYGFMVAASEPQLPLLLIKINHLLGMIASLGFVCFSLVYPNDRPLKKSLAISLISIGIIFFLLFFITDLMIPGMFQLSTPDRWGWVIGDVYFTYVIFFNAIWIIILTNLFKSAYILPEKTQRINQIYMFWGLTLGIIPPGLLNVVLPFFGVYGISWTGPIASAIWIFIIGYSIIRYRQMDVRVIITEVLAIALTIIFFINIFVQTHFGMWENIATFLVFLALAAFLIRSVLTESKQKEELRILNETLEDKVAEQTLEINKAFELEKKARRDLEKLNETKDQFIMITQHSLRSPLNNIQTGLAQLSDGDDRLVHKSLERIKTGEARLARVIDDFLAITSINTETNILRSISSSLEPILRSIIGELKLDIEAKSINVCLPQDINWPILNIDPIKIHDAFVIVIENAIKYNVEGGQINITKNQENDRIVIQVCDSGSGISKEDKEKILRNLFHRGQNAKKLNPIGMGVGLSIARTIIKAHGGELTIESEGEGMGTTVTISLPYVSLL